MQLTALQKATAQAIVNIFETGAIRGKYGDVTLLRGDTGQLTYGRSQTTLASGNLYLLMKDYTARADAAYCTHFKPYLGKLEACDSVLNHDNAFRGLLKDAGDDPVMHEVQDTFFDRVYWAPAMRSASVLGVETPLGAAIVYDSTVHGSWARIRDRVRKESGELSAIGEQAWLSKYVEARRNWLSTHANPLLHKCVYRMDAFRNLINEGNWSLALPLTVRGHVVNEDALNHTPALNVPAAENAPRVLKIKSPPVRGADVVWLQERLTRAGYRVSSGTFDQATDRAVRAFQEAHEMKADGVVGPATRAALEDLSVTTPSRRAASDVPMPASPGVRTGAGRSQERAANGASNRRPVFATVVGGAALAITELRDTLVWPSQAAAASTAAPSATGGAPAPAADAGDAILQAYQYLHGLALSLPSEWVFRLRILALVLIVYAIYRFCVGHVQNKAVTANARG